MPWKVVAKNTYMKKKIFEKISKSEKILVPEANAKIQWPEVVITTDLPPARMERASVLV